MTNSGITFESLLMLALSLTRTATAFALLPVLNSQVAPALVRNSLFVGMGVIVLAMEPAGTLDHLSATEWIKAFAVEVFVGLTIGFLFAGVLWSLEIAGDFIDQKINTARFMMTDPFSGSSATLYGGFFSRLAIYAFAASGGLLYLTVILLQSYVTWPIAGSGPVLRMHDLPLMEQIFGDLMVLALMFSAPALVAATFLDGLLGLLNRFSPQLNVFSISMAVKTWFSVLAAALTAAMMTDLFVQNVFSRAGMVEHFLARR